MSELIIRINRLFSNKLLFLFNHIKLWFIKEDIVKRKLSFLIFLLMIAGLLSLNAQEGSLIWNTFYGHTDNGATVLGMAVDSQGNICVCGWSAMSWGTPLHAHSLDHNEDLLVAKFAPDGSLLWHTYWGNADPSGSSSDGYDIVVDASDNIYVTGKSTDTWGTPVNAFSGNYDLYVAKFDTSGTLLWNTFMGDSGGYVSGKGITLDGSGNIIVTGSSDTSFGSPVNAYTGDYDILAAKFDSSGNYIWHTFLGGLEDDLWSSIACNGSGDIYVAGTSYADWGTPLNAFSGASDIVVCCLNSSGVLQWHTFYGSTQKDSSADMELDTQGNLLITGKSYGNWGTPLNAYAGESDLLVMKLDSSGSLLWHTFHGSSGGSDGGQSLAQDGAGNIYIGGASYATWGTPIHAYNDGGDTYSDILLVCLDSTGRYIWHTFQGNPGNDGGGAVAHGNTDKVYMGGQSYQNWGTPLHSQSGYYNLFVASFQDRADSPVTDITANGSDGPVSITESDSLQIRITLDANSYIDNVDYWLAYRGPSGWVHYNNSTKKWESGLGVTHQGALMDLNNKKVFQSSGLAPGNYTFYFGVDMDMNGKVTKSSLYKDEVQVTVTSN
jgi:hypothetical protein